MPTGGTLSCIAESPQVFHADPMEPWKTAAPNWWTARNYSITRRNSYSPRKYGYRWMKHDMQKQRLQVFPKDDGKLAGVQKKGLSILWVKRERRYDRGEVRPEAEKTWAGDAAADNWDRILDFGGHCDAAASCAAADNVILSFANGMTYECGGATRPSGGAAAVGQPALPARRVGPRRRPPRHDREHRLHLLEPIPVASGRVRDPPRRHRAAVVPHWSLNFVGDPIFEG